MDLDNLEKFISKNKNLIKKKENKRTLLIFDRERPNQVILSALTSLIYNKYFNLIPSVITSGDSKGWTSKIYNSYVTTKIFFVNKYDILKNDYQ